MAMSMRLFEPPFKQGSSSVFRVPFKKPQHTALCEGTILGRPRDVDMGFLYR